MQILTLFLIRRIDIYLQMGANQYANHQTIDDFIKHFENRKFSLKICM